MQAMLLGERIVHEHFVPPMPSEIAAALEHQIVDHRPPRTVGDCPLLWSLRSKRGLSPYAGTVLEGLLIRHGQHHAIERLLDPLEIDRRIELNPRPDFAHP